MRKIILAAILLSLTASIGYCQDQPLQLAIKSDKQVYEAGADVRLTATFENHSNKEQIIFWSDEPLGLTLSVGAANSGDTIRNSDLQKPPSRGTMVSLPSRTISFRSR